MDTTFNVDKEQLNVTTSRNFKATPERLWKALTEPDEISKWWGPGIYDTIIEKNDVKVDGAWRFIQTDAEGKTYAFRGIYKEISEPNKLVRTFEYEPIPGHILTETMTLNAQNDGTTTLTAIAHYANLDDLEGMVSMGMESGQRESFKRLVTLVSQ